MEIRSQQFKKNLLGLNNNEVKNFLFQVAQDYEDIFAENNLLKERNQNLQNQLESYKQMEQTLNQSIILAQQAAEMLKANAKEEANNLMEEAKKKIVEMFTLYQEVVKRLNMMNAEIKSQLDTQVGLFEKNKVRIEEYSNYFFSSDFKELLDDLHKMSLIDLDESPNVQASKPN